MPFFYLKGRHPRLSRDVSPPLVPLTTNRLLIRPFEPEDLKSVISLLDATFGPAPADDRASWLDWTIASRRELSRLYQPPYGDHAVCLRSTGDLIGSIGLVPCLAPFGLLPSFRTDLPRSLFTPEVGLFWTIHALHQRNGYAKEAAAAFALQAFRTLGLGRLVATTTRDNLASIATMRSLGMTIEQAPADAPPWFQVIGHLTNPIVGPIISGAAGSPKS